CCRLTSAFGGAGTTNDGGGGEFGIQAPAGTRYGRGPVGRSTVPFNSDTLREPKLPNCGESNRHLSQGSSSLISGTESLNFAPMISSGVPSPVMSRADVRNEIPRLPWPVGGWITSGWSNCVPRTLKIVW